MPRPRTPAEAVNGHLTDLFALENHLERTLRERVESVKSVYPELADRLQPIHGHAERHARGLMELSMSRDGRFAKAVRSEFPGSRERRSSARDTGNPLPRELGADFADVCRASIGYLILATTARALGEPKAAELAELHLGDYAEAVKGLHSVIPATIVKCLQLEGLPARPELVAGLGTTAALEPAPPPPPS
ncbi:MAG TPA: hypothetical protein VL241_10690 [Gemmatimonadales bacterium]|nr:hypothetical protein [Gemmatimonadales bacterium]